MQPSAPTDHNELLLQLYRLSHETPIQQFQDAALQLVKQVVPFDSSMWGTSTMTDSGIDIHTIHLHEKSPEMLLAYEPLKQYDSAAASLHGLGRATRGFHAKSWFDTPEERELFSVLRRFGQENFFITSQYEPDTQFVHWITLFRAGREHHCTEQQRQLLAQLAPHAMQALALNRVVHLMKNQLIPSGRAPQGSAIADLRGVLYHADPVFQSMARTEWDSAATRALPAPVLLHFLHGHTRFLGRTLVVTHRVEHKLLFLQTRFRCLADTLTPREHTVAKLLAQGDTHKEIARLLQRSPATVRNHTQAIYEKLGVSHVAGLIAELRRAD